MLQSSSSEKNFAKPLKIYFWSPICTTKGSLLATPKMKNNLLLAEITKADHRLSETFYFIKVLYVLAES